MQSIKSHLAPFARIASLIGNRNAFLFSKFLRATKRIITLRTRTRIVKILRFVKSPSKMITITLPNQWLLI